MLYRMRARIPLKRTCAWDWRSISGVTNNAPRYFLTWVSAKSGSCQTIRTRFKCLKSVAWRLLSGYRSRFRLLRQPCGTCAPKRKRWDIFWQLFEGAKDNMTSENTYDNRVVTRSSASWDCRYAEMQSLRQIRRRHRYLHY